MGLVETHPPLPQVPAVMLGKFCELRNFRSNFGNLGVYLVALTWRPSVRPSDFFVPLFGRTRASGGVGPEVTKVAPRGGERIETWALACDARYRGTTVKRGKIGLFRRFFGRGSETSC